MQKKSEQFSALDQSKQIFNSWGQINVPLYKRIRSHLRGRVLDAGCASGNYIHEFLNDGLDAYGCDILAWEEWPKSIKEKNCRADVLRLPYVSKSFDTVICLNVLEHIPLIDIALQELCRVCKGQLIISVPNCEFFTEMGLAGLTFFHWQDKSHVHFFEKDSVRMALEKAGLSVITVEGFGTVRPETLLFRSLGFSMELSRAGAKLLQMLPWRKRYQPLLIAIAHID